MEIFSNITLKIKNVTIFYGKILKLDDISNYEKMEMLKDLAGFTEEERKELFKALDEFKEDE